MLILTFIFKLPFHYVLNINVFPVSIIEKTSHTFNRALNIPYQGIVLDSVLATSGQIVIFNGLKQVPTIA